MNEQPVTPSVIPGSLHHARLSAAAGSLHTLGVLFFVLGFIAMLAPFEAALALTFMLGWIFIFGGVSTIISVFSGPAQHHPHRVLATVVGVIGILAGVLLIDDPKLGVVTLTILVAASIGAQSIVELMWASRPELAGRRTWLVINGLCGLLLSAIIFAHWPQNADWVLGFLFGIKLLFTGASFMSLPVHPPAATA